MGEYYTKQGYALIQDDSATGGHWFGGEPYHKGAKCPVCKIPLLLIADLSCVALRVNEPARLFHELDRLPLYYCWRCCASGLSYRFVAPDKLEILRNDGNPQGDDFPYRNFPAEFPRKAVSVVPIPYETAKLLTLEQEVDRKWLSEADQRTLSEQLPLLRHGGFADWRSNFHQIGGVIRPLQGHGRIGCPNKLCKAHKSFMDGYATQMKELAIICNDPRSGLPMVESMEDFKKTSKFDEWVQIVYWVCEECLTIAVSNECD
jgi:hypothetical protein